MHSHIRTHTYTEGEREGSILLWSLLFTRVPWEIASYEEVLFGNKILKTFFFSVIKNDSWTF